MSPNYSGPPRCRPPLQPNVVTSAPPSSAVAIQFPSSASARPSFAENNPTPACHHAAISATLPPVDARRLGVRVGAPEKALGTRHGCWDRLWCCAFGTGLMVPVPGVDTGILRQVATGHAIRRHPWPQLSDLPRQRPRKSTASMVVPSETSLRPRPSDRQVPIPSPLASAALAATCMNIARPRSGVARRLARAASMCRP